VAKVYATLFALSLAENPRPSTDSLGARNHLVNVQSKSRRQRDSRWAPAPSYAEFRGPCAGLSDVSYAGCGADPSGTRTRDSGTITSASSELAGHVVLPGLLSISKE
jgi:hypothetical protein